MATTSIIKGFNNLVGTVQATVDKKREELTVATAARKEGKIWDTRQQAWIHYNLEADLDSLQCEWNETVDKKELVSREVVMVKDEEYYNLLQISPNAGQDSILQAYYQTAVLCHPDSPTPDDEFFGALGEAYQVLGNAILRDAYDRDGKTNEIITAVKHLPTPTEYFNVLFGSPSVDLYISELRTELGTISAWTTVIPTSNGVLMISDDSSPEGQTDQTIQQTELEQRLRAAKCAVALKNHITALQAEPDDLNEVARRQAQSIAETAMGTEYLFALEFAWIMTADEYLGQYDVNVSNAWLAGRVACARKSFSEWGSELSVLGTAFQQQWQPIAFLPGANDDQSSALVGEGRSFLDFVWTYNKRNLQAIMADACYKLFYDSGVTMEERLMRARAIRTMGRAFQSVARQKRKEARLSIEKGALAGTNGPRHAPGQDSDEQFTGIEL